jgi:hypothetical protein
MLDAFQWRVCHRRCALHLAEWGVGEWGSATTAVDPKSSFADELRVRVRCCLHSGRDPGGWRRFCVYGDS